MRRAWRAAAALCAALALSACAGLPVSGPVQAGPAYTTEPSVVDITFRPNAPQPGATPEQIVSGFVTAASGPQGNWETARLYLDPDYRDTWQPEAGVIVDVLADRVFSVNGDDDVNLQVTPRATVDETGAYLLSDAGMAAPLSYELAEQPDGEWRITRAPDGVLLDEDLFRSVFHSYSVMYFDPSWRFLVPDVRWFPAVDAATRIADALVNGVASPWLAGSVVSAFPENVELVSVPVPGGVAQAQLSDQALALDEATLDRMQTQLSMSLATAQIAEAQMFADGTRLEADRVSTADTSVDPRALVLADDSFGFLISGEITPLPGLSETIAELDPVSVQTAPDRESAAVLLADGTVAVATDDGEVAVVDERGGLVPPAIDPFGVVWTVPSNAPAAVRATSAAGEPRDGFTAFTGSSRIRAMQISRDGTRMAAILSFGSRSSLVVSGVERDADGTPRALGEPLTLATLVGEGRDVTWLDNVSVGALSGDAASGVYLEQTIGGVPVVLEAPPDAASLAGGDSASAVRVLSGDGVLFVRRSANWVQTGAGVDVLSVQQGRPQ